MSGFDEMWLADYEARMERLRLPTRNPMSSMGEPPAVEESNATGSDRRAVVALRTPGATGEPGLQRPAKRHSRPEEALQAAIVRAWRPQLVPGARLFATNGELPGGAEQVRRAGRRKAMGYMRGCPDLLARRAGALLWLECKAGYNRQTPEQVQWADWAQRDCGDGYAVVNSVEDAGAVLRIWAMVP